MGYNRKRGREPRSICGHAGGLRPGKRSIPPQEKAAPSTPKERQSLKREEATATAFARAIEIGTDPEAFKPRLKQLVDERKGLQDRIWAAIKSAGIPCKEGKVCYLLH